MALTEQEKKRAAAYVRDQLSERGWDRARLTLETGLDPGTVRDFLSGARWPQTKKRHAIEDALGLKRGRLEMVALYADVQGKGDVDPVEQAIRNSRLSRANQHKLIGAYYGMLDEQAVGEVRDA